jgi:hypothetical protein
MHGSAESLRQQTGAALFQDLALISTPWAFDVRRLPPDIARATHIWQVGTALLHMHACFPLPPRLLCHADATVRQCPAA